MSRYKYTPEFKAKIVLEVLEGNQEIGEIAADNDLNPNMVRNWKNEFIKNSNRVFNERQSEKEIRRKEAELEQERDFLQDVFRRNGYPVPTQDKSKR